jgi:hypothetical protein
MPDEPIEESDPRTPLPVYEMPDDSMDLGDSPPPRATPPPPPTPMSRPAPSLETLSTPSSPSETNPMPQNPETPPAELLPPEPPPPPPKKKTLRGWPPAWLGALALLLGGAILLWALR